MRQCEASISHGGSFAEEFQLGIPGGRGILSHCKLSRIPRTVRDRASHRKITSLGSTCNDDSSMKRYYQHTSDICSSVTPSPKCSREETERMAGITRDGGVQKII
jgi:hypothetical protein